MGKTKSIDVSIGIDALLENGFFYLEEHKWKKAKDYFDKTLEISPRNPYPYIGKLLVTHKLPTMDSLPDCPIDFRNTNNFKTALKYADEDLKKQLETYIEQYQHKIDEKYQTLYFEFSSAQSVEDYKKCYEALVELGDYKDSLELAQKATDFITQHDYDLCVEKMKRTLTEDEYLELYNTLSKMDYKESNVLALQCKEKYSTLKNQREDLESKENVYQSALREMRRATSIADYLRTKKILERIANYKDSIELIQKCDDEINKNKTSLFFYTLWNSDIAMMVITATIFVFSLFVFSGDMLIYLITSQVIGIGLGCIIGNTMGSLGKGAFLGGVIGLVLGVPIGLICGIDLYPDSGCPYCGGKGYFGGGKYGQMVDCPSC